MALNSFLQTKGLTNPPSELSEDGKQLVADTREVIKQAKNLLLSKNDGNLIQDFIWQTTQFDPKNVQGPNTPVKKDEAQRDGDEALQGLRTLGTLLITNGQFRKLRMSCRSLTPPLLFFFFFLFSFPLNFFHAATQPWINLVR